jgi:nitroimidazol reductase NimA-like FMN-containing flavoprotein (pyridoxamine 5'-phosphate oxidase superfamily)
MRNMTEKEIIDFIKDWTWGTLIGVEGDRPYAIENTYATDGEYIYCGSMPGGRMARCIKKNPNVVYKICNADKDYQEWKAVIIEGKAERLTTREDILKFLRLIAVRMGKAETYLDNRVDKILSNLDANVIRIPLKVMGGRCST